MRVRKPGDLAIALSLFFVASAAGAADLVINEIDYDQVDTDTAEFIELKNISANPLTLSDYSITLHNGTTGALYTSNATFVLPAVVLAPGDYFVICGDAANTLNCDHDVTPNSDLLQNGANDGIRLNKLAGPSIEDAIAYEGSQTGTTETTAFAGADSNTVANIGVSRFPDGSDTNVNSTDFSLRCITPGAANVATSTSCPAPAPPPTLSINDVAINEGNAGGTTFTFTVTMTSVQAVNVTFDYATADGTAAAGSDYTAIATTQGTIAAGATSTTIAVTVNGDGTSEGNETFFVNLSNAQGAGVTFTDAQGQGTIQNDDAVTPTLSIADVTQLEGSGGAASMMNFTVALDVAAGPGGVSFDIATTTGTAGAADFTGVSLTGQTIPSGAMSYNFAVAVDADDVVEDDEAFTVDVTNVTGAIVGDAQATGTIQNDDAPIFEINQIQGAGPYSPLVTDPNPTDAVIVGGADVKVVGAIVTAITLNDASPADQNGFFMQSADLDADGNELSSEGILVFTGTAPAVSVGDVVTVVGQAQERFAQTQIDTTVSIGSVTVTGTAALPTPVEFSTGSGIPSIDPAALSCPGTGPGGANNVDTNFECFEGMRVSMPEADITRANQRRGADPYAEAFFSPLGTGSHREIGLTFPLVPGAGNPDAPQWDGEPEVLEIDGDEAGLPIAELTVGSRFSATGVIGYSFGDYEFYPTQFTAIETVPVPDGVVAAGGNQLTVGTFNTQHLCDSAASTPNCNRDTPGAGGTTLDYANKRIKVAAYICDVLGAPDVLGLQEVDRLSTLQDLEADILADCGVDYDSSLVEGDDPGDIDVGFMVNTARVSVTSVQQFYKGATWPDPTGTDILHDRPPLLLRGTFLAPMGNREFAVLNNHTKAFPNPDDEGTAAQRDRAKRFWQAEQIATLVQQFQTATGPFAGAGTDTVPLILVGDYNAYEHTDGRVDVLGMITGRYDDAQNTCNATLFGGAGVETCDLGGPNIVVPPLFNTAFAVPEADRRSYLFTPNFGQVQGFNTRDVPAGQIIDHILLARTAQGFYLDTQYGNASTGGADENWRTNAGPLRASDHDGVVAHLDFDCANSAVLNPDADTVCGMLDNCPTDANDNQADGDADGIGDACDVNNEPVAVNDAASVAEGGTVTTVNGGQTSVKANDTDAEDGIPAGLVVLGTGPSHASAFTLNGDGTFSYTHDGGEDTTDSFTYTVTDDDGAASNPATVTITITGSNDTPVAVGDAITVAEGATATTVNGAATSVRANDTDAEDGVPGGTVAVVAGPAHAAAFVLNGDGTFSYAHDGGETTSDSFTYSVTDSAGATSNVATVAITITAVNDAPTISDVSDVSVAEDGFVVVNFTIADADSAVTCANVTGTSGSQAVIADAAIVVSGAAQACSATLTPVADANGASNIVLTVTDGQAQGSDGFVLTVTPVNDAPTFVASAGTTSAEDAGARIVAGFVTEISAGPANESGQALAFQVTDNSNPALFAVAPQIAADGTLTYTAQADANGTATITVVLTDNGGGTDTSAPQTFTITVTAVDDAPAFANDPYSFSVTAGSAAGTVIGTVAATDADAGDTLSYAINTSSAPGAVQIDPATGVITVAQPDLLTTGASPLLVTVRVVDSTDLADVANVTIQITPALGEHIFGDGFED